MISAGALAFITQKVWGAELEPRLVCVVVVVVVVVAVAVVVVVVVVVEVFFHNSV